MQFKYRHLFEKLKAAILAGQYKPGQKLPSETALVNKSGASRITVGRAIRELQNAGLVDRIAGSGTYVRDLTRNDRRPHLFGLVIPDLGETEIFEPICRGIANAPEAAQHALLWAHVDEQNEKAKQAWTLCQEYIARKVSGVFFAPLEFEIEAEKVNQRVLRALANERIPVVLLDKRPGAAPNIVRHDLVGINNRQAAYIATEHLIRHGCNRIAFLGYHGAAFTIGDRMAGYREALAAYGLKPLPDAVMDVRADGPASLSWSGKSRLESIDAFVCLNDRLAGQLMHIFRTQKVRIPEDIRLVGIDDLPYAKLLPVPLTTVRQPTREIGETAMRTIVDRVHRPDLPARDILLDGELIVRSSCGAKPGIPRK
jgi:GntR family transcriptional regulator, arabinose operon transcriptional repressor